jgi:hypothetical protein
MLTYSSLWLTFFKSLDEVFNIGSRSGHSKQTLGFDTYTYVDVRKRKLFHDKTVDYKHGKCFDVPCVCTYRLSLWPYSSCLQ